MNTKKQIYEMISSLRMELQQMKKELDSEPQGYLYRCKRNKDYKFKHSFYVGNKRKRLDVTKNEEMLKKLCRKKYLINRMIIVRKNLELLESVYAQIEDVSNETIIEQMRETYRNFPLSYFFDENKVHPWIKEPYNQLNNYSEQKTFPTITGELVRSKSEQMIYDTLVEYKIPFHYEEMLNLNGNWVCPDFTIQLADESKVYWEHAGMCDIKEYMANHQKKMHLYFEAGICEATNLIVTYDRGRNGISKEIIEGNIKGYLLPFVDKIF